MTVLSMGRAASSHPAPFRAVTRALARLGAYLTFAQHMRDVSEASPALSREALDRALRRLDEALQRD